MCFLTLSTTLVNITESNVNQCVKECEKVFRALGTSDPGLCPTNRFKLKSIPKSEAGCVPYGLLSAAYKQLLNQHTGLHILLSGNPFTGLQASVADSHSAFVGTRPLKDRDICFNFLSLSLSFTRVSSP